MKQHFDALQRLRWTVLAGNPAATGQNLSLHDDAFEFWHSFWQSIFKGNGATVDVRSDDLCRQSVLSLLTDRGQIVAMQCHSLYRLSSRAHCGHSYFAKLFTEEYVEAVKKRGVERAFSMEYLSVDKEWRRQNIGVSLGAVLIGLGLKLAQRFSVDGVLAAARADLPVAKLAYEQGATPILQNQMRFNTPCDLILFPAEEFRLPECLMTSAVIESLWKRRIDLLHEEQEQSDLIAAA